MADILNKDPFTYQKERDSFLSNLRQFHANRRTPFQRVPSVGGKDVDLFLLYWKVTALGGWEKVNDEQRWEDIQELFHIPRACVSSAQALKQIYIRYLDLYEKVHFFDEDPDQRDYGEDEASKSGRKPAKRLRYAIAGVPLAYNYQQHNVPLAILNQIGGMETGGGRSSAGSMLKQGKQNLRTSFASSLSLDSKGNEEGSNLLNSFLRETNGMSMEFVEASRYKKLEMALLSGLPNEVDFAMNVCTLLSNKGRHTLQLRETPRLLELLLGHVGIYRDGPGSLQQLHREGWRPNTKRNFHTFWLESVSDMEIKEMLLADSLLFDKERHKSPEGSGEGSKKEGEEEDLQLDHILAVGRGLGVHDVEGQRIQQLAMVIRNLSFEEENAEILSSNMLVFRFLMLCIHNKYNSLKQLGLDTLANMALRMTLDPIDYRTTQLMMRTLSRCIASVDKFEIVSGMDVLAHLCQVEQNEVLLAENLDMVIYENVVRMLTLHDIQLIVFTLETLYQLSELGELASTCIARVRTAVDTLVHLVTVEAQSYGPNSLVGIKVVEHVPATPTVHMQQHAGAVMTPQKQLLSQHYGAVSTPQPGYTHKYPQTMATPPSQLASQQAPQMDSETLACNWVQAYYEYGGPAENVTSLPTISKSQLYVEYLSTCKRQGINYVVNDNTFNNCIRVVFPKADVGRLEKCDTTDVFYRGVRRRIVPLAFPPPSQPINDLCQMLQQPGGTQYATPGYSGSPSNTPLQHHTAHDGDGMSTPHRMAHTAGAGSPLRPSTPQDMAYTPDGKSTDSSLIKSLLANKVHMHRRQQAGDGSDSMKQQFYQQQFYQQSQGPWASPPMHRPLNKQGTGEKRPFNDQPRSADGKFISRKVLAMSSASMPSLQSCSPVHSRPQVPPPRHPHPSHSNEGMEVCSKSERAQDLMHSEKSVVVSMIQCVENSQQLADVPSATASSLSGDDGQYAVSRAKIERLNDRAFGATEAMIEKIENRYVTLLKQELEKQAQADQSFKKPQQVAHSSTDATSALTCQSSAASCQPSVQSSAPSCQPSAASCQPSAASCQPSVASSQSSAPSCQPSCQPSAASAQSLAPSSQTSAPLCQPSALLCQPSAPSCQSSAPSCQPNDTANALNTAMQPKQGQQDLCVTLAKSALQGVTDGVSSMSNPNYVAVDVSNKSAQNVTDTVRHILPVQNATDSASCKAFVQNVTMEDSAPNRPSLQGITNSVCSNSNIQGVTNSTSPAIQCADLPTNCEQKHGPELGHSVTKPLLESVINGNGSDTADTTKDHLDEHGVSKERTTTASVQSTEPLVDKSGLTNGLVSDIPSPVNATDKQHPNEPSERESTVKSTALTEKLKACVDKELPEVAVTSKLRADQRVEKVASMLQDKRDLKERLLGLNGVVNRMSNGTCPERFSKDSDTFATDIQEELLEKAAILSMEAMAKKNEKLEVDLRAVLENGCSQAASEPKHNSVGHQKTCHLTVTNSVSDCVTGDNCVGDKGDIAGSYPHSQLKQTLIPNNPVIEQGQGDGVCLVVTNKALSLAANMQQEQQPQQQLVLQQQQLQQQQLQISLGDISENSSTSSQGELSAALLQQPANSGMSALERAALAADIPGAAEVAAQSGVLPSPAVQGGVVQSPQMMTIASPQVVMAMQHPAASTVGGAMQPVSIQGIISQAQLVGHMIQQSGGQPIVMQGQTMTAQGQQIQILPVSSQPSSSTGTVAFQPPAVGQPQVLLPNIQLVAGAQPLFLNAQQQQMLTTPMLASQQMVGQPQVQLLPAVTSQQQQVLVSIQPQQQLRFVSPVTGQQTDTPTQFHVQIVSGAATSVATVPHTSQQINVVNILPQPPIVAAKPQIVNAQHQMSSASVPPRIQPMPSSSAPCIVSVATSVTGTATPSSGSQLSPTSAAKRAAKSPLGGKQSKKKKVARSRSNSSENRPMPDTSAAQVGQQGTATESAVQYMCEWAGCQRCFERRQALVKHAMQDHFDHSCSTIVCQWEGCDTLGRQKWSFVQHLQERHLSEVAQKVASVRRQQMPTVATDPGGGGAVVPVSVPIKPAPTPTSTATATAPVYPEDAALQAVRRFATRPPYQEFMEVKEGPVTKHIRLTSALILRNLARYSSHGRSLIKRHEQHLAYVALSSVEASTAISNCLWEIQKH